MHFEGMASNIILIYYEHITKSQLSVMHIVQTFIYCSSFICNSDHNTEWMRVCVLPACRLQIK